MQDDNKPFRLDRAAFRMGKADEAWLQENEYAKLTPHERLRIARYLIAAAYDIMTLVKGLAFDECFGQANIFEEESLQIRTVNIGYLIAAKGSVSV